MANSFTFDLKDEQSIKNWCDRVEKLNQDAERELREANQAVVDFGATAEGAVITAVADTSRMVIDGLAQVAKGFGGILRGILSALQLVKTRSDEMKEEVNTYKRNYIG